MYAGEIVETGPTAEVFLAPHHPYTAALLRSAPDEDGPPPVGIPGIVPAPTALPPGCTFAPRCPRAAPECTTAPPALRPAGAFRLTRCIRWNVA
jgi:peptide/nickel transport system permease protein